MPWLYSVRNIKGTNVKRPLWKNIGSLINPGLAGWKNATELELRKLVDPKVEAQIRKEKAESKMLQAHEEYRMSQGVARNAMEEYFLNYAAELGEGEEVGEHGGEQPEQAEDQHLMETLTLEGELNRQETQTRLNADRRLLTADITASKLDKRGKRRRKDQVKKKIRKIKEKDKALKKKAGALACSLIFCC